jgi:hypothetical protein
MRARTLAIPCSRSPRRRRPRRSSKSCGARGESKDFAKRLRRPGNYDEIKLDRETLMKIQDSMFAAIYKTVRDQATKKHGGDLAPLYYAQRGGDDTLFVRNAVVESLLELDAGLQAQYVWRERFVRQGVEGDLASRQFVLSPDVLRELARYGIPAVSLTDDAGAARYVADCHAQGVPIPPNWPDSRWTRQGALEFVFITRGLDAEVFTYRDPAVAGICYALPRRDRLTRSIEFLGMICQSQTTGKACFWDNKDRRNVPITGPDLHLDVNAIGNGKTLAETCTDCHRGDNVFNIHPGSALDLSRKEVGETYVTARDARGNPIQYVTDPLVRYSPIGQEHWVNPPSLILPRPPEGQIACAGTCHGIPETQAGTTAPYCADVLENAARLTMPPFSPRAGWPPPDLRHPLNPLFEDNITRLAACP